MNTLEKRLRRMLQAPRKGEAFELRSGLVSQYAHERKDAIERVIAAMTVGKDVSALFPDVLKNIATHDLGQKKLVYLYLMNYAKTHPELVILAVNTFVQDSEDPNPLVRALAIRTMGCIRVDKMVDHFPLPLRRTLADENPYVRKTAAIGVAKLFDLSPEVCVEEGFVTELSKLTDDANPMVVANAVAALAEIYAVAPETDCLTLDPATARKLLAALNETTEWGRVEILTALAGYVAPDAREAAHVCERVVPQFQHANPAVVLAAVRAVLQHMAKQSQAAQQALLKKIAAPLVTLTSAEPEVQYVALRNIRLVLERFPDVLTRELRVFFCRYNDPPYLKSEKLDILVRLVTPATADQLLAELREYALEVDVDFSRKAIRAIGQMALVAEPSFPKCEIALLELLEDSHGPHTLQEAVLALRDLLRRYGGQRAPKAVKALCRVPLDDLDEPDARAAVVWALGEYGLEPWINEGALPETGVVNAPASLSSLASSFLDEPAPVQLQTLTALVKLYIRQPESSQTVVQDVFKAATEQSDNADVRDRAYVYWRLLSSSTAVAKEVILASRPPIESTIEHINPGLLDELLKEMSTLSSVYHEPAASLVGSGKFGADAVQKRALEEQKQIANEDINDENLLDLDGPSVKAASATTDSGSALADLNDIFGSVAVTAAVASSSGSKNTQDILSMFGSVPQARPQSQSQPQVQTQTSTFSNDLLDMRFGSTPQQAPAQPPAQSAPTQSTPSQTPNLLDL